MVLKYYMNKLECSNIPDFLKKYLDSKVLIRLKKWGIFVVWTMLQKKFIILLSILVDMIIH